MNFYVYDFDKNQRQAYFIRRIYKNLKKRLALHNSSKGAKFTKGKKWKIIYSKRYKTKSNAMRNEYLLKKDLRKRNQIKSDFIKI